MEGDGLARALAHPHRLTILEKVHQLHEHHRQPVGAVQSQPVQRRLKPGHMAVVVGAPDVDAQIKAPLVQLVAVISDVGCKIGVEPVAPAEHVVLQLQLLHLLLALALGQILLPQEARGLQPQGPVLLVGPALLRQQAHRLLHIAAVVEVGFQKPLVILNTVLLKVSLHFGDIPLQSILGHGTLPVRLTDLAGELPHLSQKALGQFPDILPVVAVLREGVVLLSQGQLHAPGIDGVGKFGDLIAEVVDVELLPNVPSGPLQHIGQGIPQHAAPGVADVHGAGGVGGNELHHHPFPLSHIAGTIVHAGALHRREHIAKPLTAQSKIQKSRPGQLRLVKKTVCQIHMIQKSLGDHPRRLSHRLGGGQGKGGGIVSMGDILGDIHLGLHLHTRGEHS